MPDAHNGRSIVSRLAVCASIVAAVLGARLIAGQDDPARDIPIGALVWLLAGVLLWGALALTRASLDYPTPLTQLPRAGHRWKYVAIIAAVVLMLAQVEINGSVLGIGRQLAVSSHLQFALLLATIGLLVWGFSDTPLRLPALVEGGWSRWLECAAVLLLTSIALGLRLHDLEAVRAFVDEGTFLLPTTAFDSDQTIHLLRPFNTLFAFPNIYPYLQWLSGSVTDSGLVALRIPSAIFGGLTIPALYLLAKHLFDRPTAFVAAGLLAMLPVHLHWSRFGLNNAADPLFGVLTFALLARGIRHGGRWHFAAAGVCLGLTQYFYEGGRLFYPVLALVWGAGVLVFTPRLRPSRGAVVAFVASAVIVALPVYTTLAALGFPVAARYSETSMAGMLRLLPLHDALDIVMFRVQELLLFFVHRAEHIWLLFYGGDYPYLHASLLPLLPLGLAAVLWRRRSLGGALVLLWVVGLAGAVAVLMDSTNSARLLNVFPVVMLLCAVGGVMALRLLSREVHWLTWLLCAALVMAIGGLHVAYYFGVHVDRFLHQHYANQPEQELVFHVRSLSDGMRAFYVTSMVVNQPALGEFLRALNPNVSLTVLQLERDAAVFERLYFSDQSIIYINAADQPALDALRERFDLSEPMRWYHPYNLPNVEYYAYFVAGVRETEPSE